MKALLLIKIYTLVFGSFFLPMDRDASVVYESKDKVTCLAQNKFKQKTFSLLCEQDQKKLLYFEDRTPEINTTIMTDRILVSISQ